MMNAFFFFLSFLLKITYLHIFSSFYFARKLLFYINLSFYLFFRYSVVALIGFVINVIFVHVWFCVISVQRFDFRCHSVTFICD